MNQVKLYSVEVPLDILTKEHRKKITGDLGRYNAVADILEKTTEQKKAFLERCRGLFFQNLHDEQLIKDVRLGNITLDIAWLVVICFSEQNNNGKPGFPLYEFTKVSVANNTDNFKLSSIAGMFSTYMHDYDRSNIEHAGNDQQDKYSLSLDMWKILFEPHQINDGLPLFDNLPVFVFPRSLSTNSETTVYMNKLGFQEKNYTINGEEIRCFYEDGNNPLENPLLKSAILSTGLVLVEITRSDLYKGSKYIGKFNRQNFSKEVKLQQEITVLKWLNSNKLLEVNSINLHLLATDYLLTSTKV
ncbi:MAG: hypothetical protein F6K55_45990 [Moorea sp. SIO4A3]|nr:hypothetical protein [Moorena sp. SIO4A3]